MVTFQECVDANRENLALSLAGKPADHHAFWFWSSFPLITTISGYDKERYYSSYESMVDAQKIVCDATHGAVAISSDYGTVPECTGFGAKVHFDPIGFMTVHAVEEFEDNLDAIKALEPADPHGDNYMRKTLEFLECALEIAPDYPIIAPIFNAPFTASAQLYGIGEFCACTLDDEEIVTSLTNVMTETLIGFIKEVLKLLPDADHLTIGDDTASFLSPDLYAKFVIPLYKRILTEFPDKDFWLHNDGNNIHLAELTSEAGFKLWHIGRFNTPQEFLAKTQGKVSICGGINPIEFPKLSIDEAYEHCTDLLKSFEGNNRAVLSTSGFIGMGTTAEHLYAIARACNDYAI